MTNSETFVVVMITLVGAVLPSAIMVFVGIKSSNEIFKVQKQQHTYRSTRLQFLLSMDSCIAFMFIFLASLLLSVLPRMNDYPSDAGPGAYLLMILFVLFLLGVGIYIHILNLNHWKHSKNLAITYDPQSKTVWVEKNGKTYVLTADTIEKLEVHSTANYKMRFEYFKFYLHDGDTVSISGKAKGVYPIFDYFKKLPTTTHHTRMPLIR